MTLFKISVKNIRKSIRNYMIYFITIILGVAIFYVFNAISDQTVMMKIEKKDFLDIVRILGDVLSVVSVFVAVVLGFLIVYASTFLMKRRKKEFGVYMTLGMGKGKVASILVWETIIIGVLSLAIGLLLGITVSQGMSIIVANMFEADMTDFRFVVSTDAIIKTVIYFCIMYVVVLALDVIIVGKTKLINLINAGKKSEKESNKNPYICLVILLISGVLLGTAYYKVTIGFYDMTSIRNVATEIIKGIIGTFGFFWSVSGLIMLIARACKKSYFRKLNSFTTREISSRINTTVFSASIICILLFFSICIISTSFSVKRTMDNNINRLVPFDIQYGMLDMDDAKVKYDTIDEALESLNIDASHLIDRKDITVYNIDDELFPEGMYIYEAMKVSDYNKIAEPFKYDKITLADNEFAIAGNYKDSVINNEKFLSDGLELDINGKIYSPKFKKVIDGIIYMEANELCMGFLVVPDSFDMSKVALSKNRFTYANYDSDKKSVIAEYDRIYYDGVIRNPDREFHINVISRMNQINNAIGVSALFVFVGLYLGVIFIITSAALLSLKLLSEAVQNKEKYDVLRKIGVDEKMINHSVFTQCSIYFGIPLLAAVFHSIFGIQACTKIMAFYGRTGLAFSIVVTACIFIIIYGGYALLTYFTSRKMLSE